MTCPMTFERNASAGQPYVSRTVTSESLKNADIEKDGRAGNAMAVRCSGKKCIFHRELPRAARLPGAICTTQRHVWSGVALKRHPAQPSPSALPRPFAKPFTIRRCRRHFAKRSCPPRRKRDRRRFVPIKWLLRNLTHVPQ